MGVAAVSGTSLTNTHGRVEHFFLTRDDNRLLDTSLLMGILYQEHRRPQGAAVRDDFGSVDGIDTPAITGLWIRNGRRVIIHDNYVVCSPKWIS